MPACAKLPLVNIVTRKPSMTRDQFLDWAQSRDARYEFDGFQPVAMTGGSRDHNRITLNLHRALYERLKGTGCEPLGPDAGVATTGDIVRYPDALVTCTKGPGTDRLIPGVVVVFEVLSPGSGRTDRIDKVGEYRAVASVRRYVILEYNSISITVYAKTGGDDDWTGKKLTAQGSLQMPEIGIDIPVIELYEGTDLPASEQDVSR
jgi:Uma2 family endonuclease